MRKLRKFLIGVLRSIWEFLKKSFWTMINNPEAIATLILAGIGLTYLIGQMTINMNCPAWLEQTAVAETISSIIMLVLIAMMKRRDACETQSA